MTAEPPVRIVAKGNDIKNTYVLTVDINGLFVGHSILVSGNWHVTKTGYTVD